MYDFNLFWVSMKDTGYKLTLLCQNQLPQQIQCMEKRVKFESQPEFFRLDGNRVEKVQRRLHFKHQSEKEAFCYSEMTFHLPF